MSSVLPENDEPSSPLNEIRNSSNAEAKPRRKKKKAFTGSMKLIRRIHLYSGIFMFPFVFLYGITGWLFNHPTYFSSDQTTSFQATEVAGGKLNELMTPQELAQQVVRDLSRQTAENDGPKIELTALRTPQFTSMLSISAKSEDARHSLRIHPLTGDGELFTTFEEDEADEEELNPLEDFQKANVDNNPLAAARKLAPEILSDLEIVDAELSESRRSPSLIFSADVDGDPCIINYHLASGGINAEPEAEASDMKTKSFLLRMHLTRTYPPGYGWRWLWAVQVDLMVISMVFWGGSGLLMWWQIKRTRVLGAVVLAASLVGTTFLVIGMHDSLTLPRSQTRPKTTETTPEKATQSQTKSDSTTATITNTAGETSGSLPSVAPADSPRVLRAVI